MAISRNGFTTVNGATVGSMPTHSAGSLLLAWAYRTGVAVAPTISAPWAAVSGSSGAANNNAAVLAFKIAASSAESAPTFTNATQVIMVSYDGVDQVTPFGNVVPDGSVTGNDLKYPALTMVDGSGASWVVGVVGIRSGNVASVVGTAPTGMTNVTTIVDAGGGVLGSAGFHDTNTGAAAWSLVTVALGASTGHRQVTAELIAAAGGGGGVVIPVFMNQYRQRRSRVFMPKRPRLIIPGVQMRRAA